MEFSGAIDIKAPRDEVFAFVIDPQRVGPCGPGVETIEVVDATHFKVVAKVGVGFISARFVVNLEISEVRAPDFAVIKSMMARPVIFDGRNLYELDTLRAAGFTYHCIGRPSVE